MKKLLVFTALAFPLFLNCAVSLASQINKDHEMMIDEEGRKFPTNIVPEENKIEEEQENIVMNQDNRKKEARKSALRRVKERLGLDKEEKENYKK